MKKEETKKSKKVLEPKQSLRSFLFQADGDRPKEVIEAVSAREATAIYRKRYETKDIK